MRNFILFSIVYIFIFSAYYLVTSFLNILYPNWAFISFIVFYATYAIGSLSAPYIIYRINFNLLLVGSGVCFCIFVGFAGSNIVTLLLIGSFFGGLGNSTIWLIQGVFLENEEMSMFYTFFNINIVLGNLIGLIILLAGVSVQIMMLSTIAVAAIGTFISIFIKVKVVKVEVETLKIGEILHIFSSIKNIYWIVPSYFYQAVGLNITYQIIPRLLFAYTEETIYMKNIYNTIIFIVYGIFAIGGSWMWGKLFPKNWKYVVIPYSILEILCLVSILLLAKFNTLAGYWIIIGAMRGVIDYGVNNSINISLSISNEAKVVKNNFALYRFIYAVSYLISSICIGYIPYEYVLLITLISLLFSTITFFPFQNLQQNVYNQTDLKDIEKQFKSSQIQIS